MTTLFEIYTDRKNETRWRAKRGGRIVGDSGEGYKRKAGCKKSLRAFITSIQNGEVTFRFALALALMLSTLCAQGSTNVVRMSPVPPSTELADMVATINAVRCVRCVSPQIRYDGHSIVATNGIASGTNGPRATLLRFDFKCRKCGVKFRKIEVRQTGATL